MALIQYCLDSNYPFNQEDYEQAVCCEDPIPLLKLFRGNGYVFTEGTCALAAKYGDVQLLRWLKYKGCPWDEETCIQAVLFKHYGALVNAHENGCTWTKRTYAACFDLENRLGLQVLMLRFPLNTNARMKFSIIFKSKIVHSQIQVIADFTDY